MKRLILLLIIVSACSTNQKDKKLSWFKGNTHSHTVISGHADTHPDSVALWYLEQGYNFVILSEHNKFIDPNDINLPKERRDDFILIPGEEVSDPKHIHTTAMNINKLVIPHKQSKNKEYDQNRFDDFKVYLMQKHVDSIRIAGGIPILNHPNWESGVSAKQMGQVDRLNMIELYNGHPEVNNWGNKKHASMEQKWDSLLTVGRKVYAVASDDAHFFKRWGVKEENPGRGWVMVQSESLNSDAITNSMVEGNFYASSGVILKNVIKSPKRYQIDIDVDETKEEANSPFIVSYKTSKEKEGFKITFIADNGKIIKETTDLSTSINVPDGITYLRAKITYTRFTPSKKASEQFFAWTQPIFLK